jgi:chromosome partitioning protein
MGAVGSQGGLGWMSEDGKDLKRRGMRIFASLRRTEQEAADVPPEPESLEAPTDLPPAEAPPVPEADERGLPGSEAEPAAPAGSGAQNPNHMSVDAPMADTGGDEVDGTPEEDRQVDLRMAELAETQAGAQAAPTRQRTGVRRQGGDATAAPAAGIAIEPSPPLVMPRIIAIANQKGGVGKTTTAVNLGAALAEAGFRVLVVDLDPQGNATTGLGINARDLQGSVYDVIMNDAPIEDCIEPTSLKNLFVAPATIDLAGAEIELVPAFSRELKMRRALEGVKDQYDIVLVDCPPSLGLITINGLAAADDVIVPVQCEYYALEGLGQLLRNVNLVRNNLNPTLDVRGMVLTMFDARTKLSDQVEANVRSHFGAKVYRTVIPRTVRLSEAPSFGQPIILFDSTSRGAIAYRELAKEVSRGATRRPG